MLFSLLCFLFTFAKVQIISVTAKINMLIIINVLFYFQNTSIGYLPIFCLFSLMQLICVDPDPEKGSNTISPSLLLASTYLFINFNGF